MPTSPRLAFSHSIFVLLITSALLRPYSVQAADVLPGSDVTNPAKVPLQSKKTVWVAEIERPPDSARISQLELPATKMPVILIPKEGRFRPMVEIHGYFRRPGWSLWIQDKIPVSKTQDPEEFVIYAYLNSVINEVSLAAKGPQGEIEREKFLIHAPEVQEFKVISPWDALQVSSGFTYLRYEQTSYSNFNSLNGRIGAKYNSQFNETIFGLLADVNVTVLTFSSGPTKGNPQILEAKLDGTMQLPFLDRKGWKAGLLGGASYLTMFSNGMPFGFSNLMAPEGGFIARYGYNTREVFVTELRYIALDSKSFLEQRGLGLNFLWSWNLNNLHRAEAGLALSHYKYNPTLSSNVDITLATLVFSYSL